MGIEPTEHDPSTTHWATDRLHRPRDAQFPGSRPIYAVGREAESLWVGPHLVRDH